MTSSAVTWLLPIKNGLPFLEETLRSIASQEYPNQRVLAWDNGSTDGTVELLKEWIPSRIDGKLVTNQPLPLGRSLAAMVEMADTELLARIDADDVAMPERLSRQVAYMEAHPDVAVVGSQAIPIDVESAHMNHRTPLPTTSHDILLRMLRRWSIWHPSVLMRRSKILEAGNYRDETPVEDYSLWLRVAKVGRLANLEDSLLLRREHDESITKTELRANRMKQAIRDCKARYVAEWFEGKTFQSEAGQLATSKFTRLRDLLAVCRVIGSLSGMATLRVLAAGEARQYWKEIGASFRRVWFARKSPTGESAEE